MILATISIMHPHVRNPYWDFVMDPVPYRYVQITESHLEYWTVMLSYGASLKSSSFKYINIKVKLVSKYKPVIDLTN